MATSQQDAALHEIEDLLKQQGVTDIKITFSLDVTSRPASEVTDDVIQFLKAYINQQGRLQQPEIEYGAQVMIKQALKDWSKGNLSSFSAILVIDSLVNPVQPSEEDIEWARRQMG